MTKELTRFEMAAVKRTAQNVKTMRRKKDKLEAQQAIITKEINDLNEMIMAWEEPILKMTGGFTSEQILAKENEIEVAETIDENSVSTEALEVMEVDPSNVKEVEELVGEEIPAEILVAGTEEEILVNGTEEAIDEAAAISETKAPWEV